MNKSELSFFYVERSQKKKEVSQPSRKGAIIVVGDLPDRDSSLKKPEKSDNTSTSKQPEIDFSESFSDSSEEEILIPDDIPTSRTPSPVPKPPRHLIPSPADISTSQTPCPLPKPPHFLIPDDIPTLETASPVTRPTQVTRPTHHGALSIPSCDPDWYHNNPYELQPDTQQTAGDKISQSGKLDLMTVHVCMV